jgi:hypothetical protein
MEVFFCSLYPPPTATLPAVRARGVIAEFALEYFLQASLLIGKAPAEFYDVSHEPFSQIG